MWRAGWIGLFLLMVAVPAAAHPVGGDAPYVVRVEDTHGHSLRTFHADGKTYVLGTYGKRYNIRVRNQTGRRIEAVVTVDGRDVVSGRQGDYRGERGYIIRPYGDVLIEGFRTSETSVAAFRFTNPANSYSARMGTPQHVGVIGVAVFRERVAPRPHRHRRHSRHHSRGRSDRLDADAQAEAGPAPGKAAGESMAGPSASASRSRRAAPEPRNNLGTEYGEATESHVRMTHFRRERPQAPNQVIVLHYDNADGLRARGIPMHRPHPERYATPSPFPRNRFAPPPPH